MQVVALVSGGKDSCYAMMECVRYGHEVVCLAHLHPPTHLTPEEAEIDSFMYQSVGHNVVQMIAASMELPLVTGTINGKAITMEMDYTTTDGDEVEDLYRLLENVKIQFPNIKGVCSGAIFSSYQRNRVENVCSRLGLTPLSYLWRRNQEELLNDMIHANMEAILVKVAAIGLHANRHLGRTITDLQMQLLTLQSKYQLNVCGEGGEYETVTLDCPLFKKRIVIDASHVVLHSDDYFAPVAFLVIDQCHLEEKPLPNDKIQKLLQPLLPRFPVYTSQPIENQPLGSTRISGIASSISPLCFYRNQFYISGITSLNSSIQTLEEEMTDVLMQLTTVLSTADMSLEDVCFVHVYVHDMNDFARLNEIYSTFFPSYLPPSRSCIELSGLPSRVLVDCFGLRGSGTTKYNHPRSSIVRDVLHIKSISAWAPHCIGPYSQANIVHSALILLAGQIALQPQTMKLIGETHEQQLEQSMRNAGAVLEALDSSLKIVTTAIVYVSIRNEDENSVLLHDIALHSRQYLRTNAGVADPLARTNVSAGTSDSDSDSEKSEVEDNMNSLVDHVPLLVVQVSQLPRFALIEVELQAFTNRVIKCREPQSFTSNRSSQWTVLSQSCTIPRSLCQVITTASRDNSMVYYEHDVSAVVSELLHHVEETLITTSLSWCQVLHLRVMYIPSIIPNASMIATQITKCLAPYSINPALTMVPVEAMYLDSRQPHIAFQVTAHDLDKLETDLWLLKQL